MTTVRGLHQGVDFETVIHWLAQDIKARMTVINPRYEGLAVTPRLTKQTRFLAFIWNEGSIDSISSMRANAVRADLDFEFTFISQVRKSVTKAVQICEGVLYEYPSAFRVTQDSLDIAEELTYEHYDDNICDHEVERLMLSGRTITYDPAIRAWRGKMSLKASIANTGYHASA